MSLHSLDDKFKKLFLSNELVIDCHKITLLQNSIDKPEQWSGSGYLKIDKRNGVEARLISTMILDEVERFEKAFGDSGVVSGQLYPKSHFYAMEAEDVNGRVWQNPEVAISFDYQQEGTIVTFKCDWIKFTETGEFETDYVHMLFLDELPFPRNTRQRVTTELDCISWTSNNYSTSKATLHNLNIKYQREPNGYSELYVTNNKKIGFIENIESKLIEAIRFISARNIDYSVVEKVNSGIKEIEIRRSNIQKKNMSLLGVPLSQVSPLDNDCFKMFACYLSYCINSGNQDKFAFLSKVLGTIQSMHNVHAESVALILSVNIESILQQEFKKAYAKRDEELTDDIRKIKQALVDIELKDSTRSRVDGLFSAISGVRAIDKLVDLHESGVITMDEVQAWKSLRNSSAHGGLHIKQEEFQQLLDKIYKSIGLMYKLIFLIISYSGKFVDYSKTGWPVLEFDASKYPEYSSKVNNQ